MFITAEQVKHGKPQPDAYLLGAERQGLRRTSAWWLKTRRPAFSPARRRAAVIAVNAPADAPKLDQVDLRLDSLAQIAVDKTAQGAIVRRLA